MNKVVNEIVLATLVFAMTLSVGCSLGSSSKAAPTAARAAVVRTADLPYVTVPGDTLAKVAAAHGIGFGEIFLASENLLTQGWEQIPDGGSQSLAEAFGKLDPELRVKVATALNKPAEDWLPSDKEAVAAASVTARYQFGKQASASNASGLGDLLGAGTVLVVPPTSDAPKDLVEFAKSVPGSKVVVVFYASGDAELDGRTIARWLAQGLRLASKSVNGIVVVSGDGKVCRTYDAQLQWQELKADENDAEDYISAKKAVEFAASLRPEGIVLLTNDGDDEWSDDLERWAKSLPPVTVRLVSRETDEPDFLTKLAKASKGKFVKVDR